nr:unnamed protein product [Digitaria exilis]
MVSGHILVRFVFLVLYLRSYVAQSPAATRELQQPAGLCRPVSGLCPNFHTAAAVDSILKARQGRARYSIPPIPPIAGAGASSLGISTMMDSVVSLGGDPPPFLGGRLLAARKLATTTAEAGISTHSDGVRVAAEEAGASARGGKGDVYCGQQKKKQAVEA